MLPALELQVTVKAAKEGHRLRAAAQLEVSWLALNQACLSINALRAVALV